MKKRSVPYQLTPYQVELLKKAAVQETILALWSATFSRYLSIKANGVKKVSVDQVIKDYESCVQFHRH